MEAHSLEHVELIITCKLGFEKIVASYIQEFDHSAEVYSAPHGFSGLVLVAKSSNPQQLYTFIRSSVPEVEKVFLVENVCRAVLDELAIS